jgi:hypothetical protein
MGYASSGDASGSHLMLGHQQEVSSEIIAIWEACGRPIGCKVKRESEAFSDDFSACLLIASQPVLRQHSIAPPRFPSRRRLTIRPSPSPCLSPGSGTPSLPRQVKAARGPASIGARSASLPVAHRALVLALTGGVGSPQPEPGCLTFALFPLRLCLAGRVTPVAAATPPLSSPVAGACRRV